MVRSTCMPSCAHTPSTSFLLFWTRAHKRGLQFGDQSARSVSALRYVCMRAVTDDVSASCLPRASCMSSRQRRGPPFAQAKTLPKPSQNPAHVHVPELFGFAPSRPDAYANPGPARFFQNHSPRSRGTPTPGHVSAAFFDSERGASF